MKINYDESLLSLIASIQKHYGIDAPYKTLPCVDKLLEKSYKNVVVMLFDGLGSSILEKHLPSDSFLRAHNVKSISSVFPPTTTAATTTMVCGSSPVEHAWLGWSLYFKELDKNVALFPNVGDDGEHFDYNVAREYIPYGSVLQKINEATSGEVEAYFVSPFSAFASQSLEELCGAVKELCSQQGRKYIYAYWHQPDFDMHRFGTRHKTVTEQIMLIDKSVQILSRLLNDTLIIVTADHGMIDVKWKFLREYPDIYQCLSRVPSVETRAISFFVKEGMKERFETSFKKHFGKYYKLYTKEQALEMQLFGEGVPHERVSEFIGDYLAIATGRVSIEPKQPKQPREKMFKAAHAGFTPDEMNVPLIIIEK